MKSNIYFITGVNGAGKSTLVPILKKSLGKDFAVYDFDELGVPVKVDKKWRQKTTRHWLRLASKNIKKGTSTIICGLVHPKEVHDLANSRKNINIYLLDISAKEIRLRLKKRFKTKATIKNLKEVTGLSVSQCIEANILNAKKLRQEAKEYKCKVFNTSHTSVAKTKDKIIKQIFLSSKA